MAEKSFTQVAVKNNQVVGIIIGDLKDQKLVSRIIYITQ